MVWFFHGKLCVYPSSPFTWAATGHFQREPFFMWIGDMTLLVSHLLWVPSTIPVTTPCTPHPPTKTSPIPFLWWSFHTSPLPSPLSPYSWNMFPPKGRHRRQIPLLHFVPLSTYLLPTPFAQPSGCISSLECHQLSFLQFSNTLFSFGTFTSTATWLQPESCVLLTFHSQGFRKRHTFSPSWLLIPLIPRSHMPPNLIDAFQFISLLAPISQRDWRIRIYVRWEIMNS